MTKLIDSTKLKIGQKVNYGFYNDITFEGFDNNNQVLLKDKNNNIKKVYKDLFEKYAKI